MNSVGSYALRIYCGKGLPTKSSSEPSYFGSAAFRRSQMKESELIQYFDGKLKASNLKDSLRGSVEYSGGTMISHLRYDSSESEIDLTKKDILKICNDFLDGNLDAEDVKRMSFSTMASDCFMWDSGTPEGGFIASCFDYWSSPEVDGEITNESVSRIKQKCEPLTGENASRPTA